MQSKKEVTFRISKTQFWIITVLIVLLPISTKYKLFLLGKRTEGIVVYHEKVFTGFSKFNGYDTYSVIQFQTDSSTIRMYGPENYLYDIGHKVTVIYDKQNPKKCVIVSFPYIYTSHSVILPAVLLLVWLAFFLAFKNGPNQNVNKKHL